MGTKSLPSMQPSGVGWPDLACWTFLSMYVGYICSFQLKGSDNDGGRKKDFLEEFFFYQCEQMKKSIRFTVLGSWIVGEGKQKPFKEEGPSGLMGVKPFGHPKIL